MAIAGVRREANSFRIRRIQIASQFRANPFRDEAVQEGAGKVQDRQGLDFVFLRQTAAEGAHTQNRRASRQGTQGERCSMDVTEVKLELEEAT